jgi:hypothetical protein
MEGVGKVAHDDGDEGILELLAVHLCVHVDAGQPAAVAGMRVVPADRILEPLRLYVCDVSTKDQTRRARRTFSHDSMYWIMNSFASFAAFTRVSVPCTGSANESMMTSALPTTLPCIRPMISYGTPERAWMTCARVSLPIPPPVHDAARAILISATAEILHDLKKCGLLSCQRPRPLAAAYTLAHVLLAPGLLAVEPPHLLGVIAVDLVLR